MAKNFVESQIDFVKSVKLNELKNNQKIGILGAVVLLIGTFLPIIKFSYFPLTSVSLNLYSLPGFGLFAWLLGLSALISGYLLLFPKAKYVIYSNIVASLVFLFTFFNVWGLVSQVQSESPSFGKQSSGGYNPAGFATTEIQFLTMLILLVGIVAIFYAVRDDLMPLVKKAQSKIAAVSTKATNEMKKDEITEVKEVETEAKKEEKEAAQQVKTEVKE